MKSYGILLWWRFLRNLRGYKLLLAVVASIAVGTGHGYIDALRLREFVAEHRDVFRLEQERVGRAQTYSTALPAVIAKPEIQTLVVGRPIMGGAALLRGVFGGPIFFSPYSRGNPYLYFRMSGGFGGSLLILFGIFTLSLTYNTVSMNKRINSMRLLFSFGISRRCYVLAEWSAAVVTMTIPMFAATASFLVTTALVFSPISVLSISVISVLILTFLTISIFAWMGIWFSASCKTERSSLTLSIVFWAVATWVWPWIASESAQLMYPMSGQVSFAADGPSPSDSQFIATLPKTPPPRIKSWMSEYSRVIAEGYVGRQTLGAGQRNTLGLQLSAFEKLSVLSPVTLAKSMLDAVTGGGGYGARRFFEFSEDANRSFRDWQYQRLKKNPLRVFIKTDKDPPLQLSGLQTIHEYTPTSGGGVRLMYALIPLIFWNGIACFAAIFTFNLKSLVQIQ